MPRASGCRCGSRCRTAIASRATRIRTRASSPGACARCHTTSDWKTVNKQNFDHEQTRYPLRGAHVEVKCETCHAAKFGGAKPRFAQLHGLPRRCAQGPGDARRQGRGLRHLPRREGVQALDLARRPAPEDEVSARWRAHAGDLPELSHTRRRGQRRGRIARLRARAHAARAHRVRGLPQRPARRPLLAGRGAAASGRLPGVSLHGGVPALHLRRPRARRLRVPARGRTHGGAVPEVPCRAGETPRRIHAQGLDASCARCASTARRARARTATTTHTAASSRHAKTRARAKAATASPRSCPRTSSTTTAIPRSGCRVRTRTRLAPGVTAKRAPPAARP